MGFRLYILLIAILIAVGAAFALSQPPSTTETTGMVTNQPLETDMDYYPELFLQDGLTAVFVVDDQVALEEDIAAVNAIASGLGLKSPEITRYGQLESIAGQNGIFIGTCNTDPPNRFTNIYVDCLSLEQGKATIRLTETQGHYILFAVGSNPEATLMAGQALSNWEEYGVPGREIEVSLVSGEISVKRIK